MTRLVFLSLFCLLLSPGAASAASVFTGALTGAQEVPPNASPASGTAELTLDGDTLAFSLSWSGLIGGAVAGAHLHCCNGPGVNSPIALGFDESLFASPNGSFNTIVDLLNPSVYNATFLANNGGAAQSARDALVAALFGGLAYFNIHTSDGVAPDFPGGEIRADLAPVPLPAALWLFGLGLGALGAARLRAKR